MMSICVLGHKMIGRFYFNFLKMEVVRHPLVGCMMQLSSHTPTLNPVGHVCFSTILVGCSCRWFIFLAFGGKNIPHAILGIRPSLMDTQSSQFHWKFNIKWQ